jgi:hypothetical protein
MPRHVLSGVDLATDPAAFGQPELETIPDTVARQFATLVDAARHNELALIETVDPRSSLRVYVAARRRPFGATVIGLVHLAILLNPDD